MTRENFLDVLRQQEFSQETIDQWINQSRAHDAVQMCIVGEGHLRIIGIRYHEPVLSNFWADRAVSKALAKDWQDRLAETIATGDRES